MNREDLFRLQGLAMSAKNSIDELFTAFIDYFNIEHEEEKHIVKSCKNCFWGTGYCCTHNIARRTVHGDSCLWYKEV